MGLDVQLFLTKSQELNTVGTSTKSMEFLSTLMDGGPGSGALGMGRTCFLKPSFRFITICFCELETGVGKASVICLKGQGSETPKEFSKLTGLTDWA